MTKVDRSEELESVLEQVLQNTQDLDKLSKELGLGEEGKGEEGSKP
jgi:type VI secretion system protein ImpB